MTSAAETEAYRSKQAFTTSDIYKDEAISRLHIPISHIQSMSTELGFGAIALPLRVSDHRPQKPVANVGGLVVKVHFALTHLFVVPGWKKHAASRSHGDRPRNQEQATQALSRPSDAE